MVFHCEYTRDLREKYEVGESKTLVRVYMLLKCSFLKHMINSF